MNSPDVLYFQCQACGQQLSVPMELAGVTGPCPACHGQITAPTAQEAARAAALSLTQEKVSGGEISPAHTPVDSPAVQSPRVHSDAALAGVSEAASAVGTETGTVQKAKTAIPVPRSVEAAVLPDQGVVREKVRFSHAQVSGAETELAQSAPAIPQQRARTALPPKRAAALVEAEAESIVPAEVNIRDQAAAGAAAESLVQQGVGLPLPGANRGAAWEHGSHPIEPERPVGNLLARNMGMGGPKPWTMPKEPSGRGGIFVVALLLVTLGIAGVSYAFQDQLRVMWHIYFPQKDEVERPERPSPTGAATTRQARPNASSSAAPVKPTPTEQRPVAPQPQPRPVQEAVVPVQSSHLSTPPSSPVAPASLMLPPHPRIEEASTISQAEDKEKAADTPPVEKTAVAPSRQVPALFLKPPAEMKGAVEVLREFLSAGTWRERSQWVQWAETVRPLMEQYYLSNEDRAVEVAEVVPIPKYDQGGEGGLKHFVFELIGGDVVGSVPVMIEETKAGWKVDWLTFIEGKDRLLEKFFSAYRDQPARFRVLARRKPFIENRSLPNIESKMCFEVQPPSPGFVGYVYAEAGTPLASQLDRVLGWEVLSAALVVELRWQRAGDQQWVEVVDVPYLNWRTPDPAMQNVQR